MTRSRIALLTALGVDNFGSGLFLPVVLLYVTRVVGLPLAVAGTVVAVGTVAGLAVPPEVGRLVDRAGPRQVVIAAELVQALGAVTYLTARGPAAVAAVAVLLAAGQQAFYSALFALIADVATRVGRAGQPGRPARARPGCWPTGRSWSSSWPPAWPCCPAISFSAACRSTCSPSCTRQHGCRARCWPCSPG